MINYEKVEKFFNDNYYVSSELLNYYTLRGINLINESKILDGQDIYAVCLDGPPGAGKSMYAKLYAQMVHNLLNTEVSLISYQCDDTTSKIELFEDINVGASVAGRSEKVNIPGVIARAILEANKGKKVILFIDEYDKSREQVDSLFLQFLQDGRINTNQFGDLEIKQEYKGNIQVIFCKNDFRTELTGPLTRRIRKINLKVIKPSDFMNLARRKFINNNNYEIVMPIIELVSLIYESVYENADYTRIPATSEMFGAIEDLIFLNKTKAPSNIVYNILIEDLFKNEDDRELFNSSLDTIESGTLKKILTALKGSQEEVSIKSNTVWNAATYEPDYYLTITDELDKPEIYAKLKAILKKNHGQKMVFLKKHGQWQKLKPEYWVNYSEALSEEFSKLLGAENVRRY